MPEGIYLQLVYGKEFLFILLTQTWKWGLDNEKQSLVLAVVKQYKGSWIFFLSRNLKFSALMLCIPPTGMKYVP